jgi:hypothetical protein
VVIVAIVLVGIFSSTDEGDDSTVTAEPEPRDAAVDETDSAAEQTPPPKEPTVTPEPSTGTRVNPVPLGDSAAMTVDSFGDADGSVWTVVVDEPWIDYTDAVAAENQFNDPPPEGSIYFAVPISATLQTASKEPLSTLFNIEFEFFGPSTLSIIGSNLDNLGEVWCGVTPDEFPSAQEVFVGGTVSGVICFAVPDEDVATGGVLLTTDSGEGDRIFMATSTTTDEVIGLACLADMEASAAISDLEDSAEDLWPTFSSCTSLVEWQAAASETGEADRIDIDLWVPNQCDYEPTVFDTPLCRSMTD